jgi:acyl-CoA thioester hydrolase
MSLSTRYTLDVPFFDVDSMNIVWHGHYAKYFELARCQLLDEMGFNYQTMACEGYAFPIIDLQVKYIAPLNFNQRVDVVATLTEWEYRLKIDYQVLDHKNQQRLSKGHTVQVAVDAITQKMLIGSPTALVEKIERVLADNE